MKLGHFIGAATALLIASSASADISFVYTSTSTEPFSSFSFVLPDDFTIVASDATTFTVGPVDTQSNSQFGPVVYGSKYRFYTAAAGGAFDSDFDVYEGPALFTGTPDAPRFVNGIYQLDNFVDAGTLVISGAAASPTPEPAIWALMIGGFGLVGTAMRRRAAVPA